MSIHTMGKTTVSANTTLLLGFAAAVMCGSAQAKPEFEKEIGAPDCVFCHSNATVQGDMNFTRSGAAFRDSLIRKNRLDPNPGNLPTPTGIPIKGWLAAGGSRPATPAAAPQPAAAPRCRMQTINLFDQQGNFMQQWTHCVP